MRPARAEAPVALALAVLAAGGCNQRGAPPGYVIVGMTNSALNLDPRVGADEASQIEAAASAPGDPERGAFYARAQQLIAEDVPYIGLWYKTNVAVFQRDIHGVQLTPIADFTFLKDVYRQAR